MHSKNEERKGYLKKLKNSLFNRIFGNTNLRWFELNFKTKKFYYKQDHTSQEIKNIANFNDIVDVNEKMDVEVRRLCEWSFPFCLTLRSRREYILYCQTKTELNNWMESFNMILGRLPKPKSVPPVIPQQTVKREIQVQVKYEAPPKVEPIEKPVEPPEAKPVIIEERPVKKKVIVNDNIPKQNMNSSNMLYDQDLSDLIEDVNKSVHIEDNYLSTNNLNRSYTSNNNSQILVNLKLDDWDYYDEDGSRLGNEKLDNKELEEMRKRKLLKRIKEEKRKRALEVENLHNNQAKGDVKRRTEEINKVEYEQKKKDFEHLMDFLGDKQIVTNLAKADITKSMNKTTSTAARETLRKLEEEEKRKEIQRKYKYQSQIKEKQPPKDDSSFNEEMMNNYMKNKNKYSGKVSLNIMGNNSKVNVADNSFNSNNNQSNTSQNRGRPNVGNTTPKGQNKKQAQPLSKSITVVEPNGIRNNSRLLMAEQPQKVISTQKQKLKEELYKLQDKFR